MKSFFKGLKTPWLVVIIIVAALVIFRIALPGIVKNYVNKKLNELPGYTGHVDDIGIKLMEGCLYHKGACA